MTNSPSDSEDIYLSGTAHLTLALEHKQSVDGSRLMATALSKYFWGLFRSAQVFSFRPIT
jgi:hypothetical protein